MHCMRNSKGYRIQYAPPSRDDLVVTATRSQHVGLLPLQGMIASWQQGDYGARSAHRPAGQGAAQAVHAGRPPPLVVQVLHRRRRLCVKQVKVIIPWPSC